MEILESRIAPAFGAVFELSALTGENGFQIRGVAADDRAGYSASAAGDINGDGLDDLIVGAISADPRGFWYDTGAAYVVFGSSGGFAPNLNLADLSGANGFRLTGEVARDRAGRSVSGAGDVNGDGIDDLIIGAFSADPHGSYSGASYVVFGSRRGFAANVDLSALTGANGFQMSGVAVSDGSGFSVSGAGDINGDGLDDVLIGALRARANGRYSGASYVVFGSSTTFPANLDLSALTGGNGFRIGGAAAYDYSGRSVSGAGDINGDGIDDLLVGAHGADPHGSGSGASYVVFGSLNPFAANLNLSDLMGSNGFKISGVLAGDDSGRLVSAAGDINGDGIDDLLIGAHLADPNGASSGATYVIFGQPALPDLDLVSNSDGRESLQPGQTASYTLAYRNDGAAEAINVTLTETLPAGTIFNAGASSAGWVESPAGSGTFLLDVGTLARNGAGGTVIFAADVLAVAAAERVEIVNRVTISSSSGDANLANNRATDTDALLASPDLEIAKTDDVPLSVVRGGLIHYTLTFSNVGNQDATGVFILENVPANSSFVAAESDAGWVLQGDGRYRFEVIGGLAGGGGSGSVVFAVRIDAVLPGGLRTIENTALLDDDSANSAEDVSDTGSLSTLIYQGIYAVVTDRGDARPASAGARPIPSTVRVFDIATCLETSFSGFLAYEPRFKFGARVAVGDFNGDGYDDIITAAARGAGRIRVWSGEDGSRLPIGEAMELGFGREKGRRL